MILLSAGHGGNDPGAMNKDGRKEADIAVEMRNMVAYYVRRDGKTKVVTDGAGKTNFTLRKALGLFGVGKPQLAIEFHTNAFGDPRAKGVEALAQEKDKYISRKLCESVSKSLSTTVRGSRGGWKSEGSGQHSRLGFVRKGGIILELFFITNPDELAEWDARKWLVAKDVAKVILAHVEG